MQELLVANPAPSVSFGRFLKGGPMSKLQVGKIYVLEFRSPICGPYRTAVPHLTELQQKFPRVAIIGLALSGSGEGSIEAHIPEQGNKISYRKALDTPPTEGGAILQGG